MFAGPPAPLPKAGGGGRRGRDRLPGREHRVVERHAPEPGDLHVRDLPEVAGGEARPQLHLDVGRRRVWPQTRGD